MIALRTDREIGVLREANQIVADILATVVGMVIPGVTTDELNAFIEEQIRRAGVVPAFLGYRGFPKASCISVDNEVIHGIPGKRRVQAGLIVSIDVGVLYKGYYGDAAISVPCGYVDAGRERLLRTADRALAKAIEAVRPGHTMKDVSRAIQSTCENEGFSVVRAFVGHGIGTRMHEDPPVPNFVSDERGPKLRPGMVFAIEPMVNMGGHEVRVQDDGWTAVTTDGKPSAHFEHTVAVRKNGVEILSLTPKYAWGVPRATH